MDNFDSSKYDYMDNNLSMDGWIWEFVRRNSGYRALCKRFKKYILKFPNILRIGDTKSIDTIDQVDIDLWFNVYYIIRLRDTFCIQPSIFKKKSQEQEYFSLYKIQGTNKYVGIPDPQKAYNEFKNSKPIITRTKKPLTFYKLDKRTIKEHQKAMSHLYDEYDEFTQEGTEHPDLIEHADNVIDEGDRTFNRKCSEIIKSILPIHTMDNTLYLGVSMKANIEDIKKEFNEIIKMNIKPSTKKNPKKPPKDNKLTKNSKIWKSYLIVYDLVKSDMSYVNISNMLASESERYFDLKYIENHYKSAERLIQGDYHKYLLLEK